MLSPTKDPQRRPFSSRLMSKRARQSLACDDIARSLVSNHPRLLYRPLMTVRTVPRAVAEEDSPHHTLQGGFVCYVTGWTPAFGGGLHNPNPLLQALRGTLPLRAVLTMVFRFSLFVDTINISGHEKWHAINLHVTLAAHSITHLATTWCCPVPGHQRTCQS